MELQPDTLLQQGKYKIISSISGNDRVRVYEARHMLLGSHVCIKEFFCRELCHRNPGSGLVEINNVAKQEEVDRLGREFMTQGRMLNCIVNPAIPRCHDMFSENGTVYLVTDLVQGISLQSIIKQYGSITEPTATKYAAQIAAQLECMHQAGYHAAVFAAPPRHCPSQRNQAITPI